MPTLPLEDALVRLGDVLAGGDLLRALASGRRRGQAPPDPERVEVRPVLIDERPHLQVTARTGPAVRTSNHPLDDVVAARGAVDALLAVPWATWHVETGDEVLQLRVTKRGAAQLHRSVREAPAGATSAGATAAAAGAGTTAAAAPSTHDRRKAHLLAPDDPLFTVLGADGDKRKQVDAFLRQLAAATPGVAPAERGAASPGRGAAPAGAGSSAADQPSAPLRVVDLGCGNAYLTLAAHRFLTERGEGSGPARTVGVELREDLVARSTERAARVGLDGVSFVAGTIDGADPEPSLGGSPDVVLALHACDTATDDALARAVRWEAPVVLAAPCCHHDVQRQLGTGSSSAPDPYAMLTRHAILRERFADVLTDALRASILRLLGYRVDVVEFVGSAHTPRNAMIRAVRTGARPTPAQVAEYRAMTAAWGVRPALADRLAPELEPVLSGAAAS